MKRPARLNNEQRFKQRMGHRKNSWNSGKGKGKIGLCTGNGSRRKATMAARAKQASTVSVEILRVMGGHNQTSRTLKMISISALWNIHQTLPKIILENSTNVGKGAVMLGYQNEWRNGRFKNILMKQEQDHCTSIRNKFQMFSILESERNDDDAVEAQMYVF